MRAVLRDVLEFAGHEVAEAPDGAVALEYLQANHEPAVVLLDREMPRCDGVQFLRAVAADPVLASRHRYVVMTGDSANLPDDVRHLLAVPVVLKFFDCDDLLAAVEVAAESLTAPRRPTDGE
jgi:two-component system chemotaxis response regulator CheY